MVAMAGAAQEGIDGIPVGLAQLLQRQGRLLFTALLHRLHKGPGEVGNGAFLCPYAGPHRALNQAAKQQLSAFQAEEIAHLPADRFVVGERLYRLRVGGAVSGITNQHAESSP